MKILHLTLKKKWFDMTESGVKKEEYREIKPYWIKRLCKPMKEMEADVWREFVEDLMNQDDLTKRRHRDYNDLFDFFQVRHPDYTHALLKNGYSQKAPQILRQIYGYFIGEGKPEWGAEPGRKYFVIQYTQFGA